MGLKNQSARAMKHEAAIKFVFITFDEAIPSGFQTRKLGHLTAVINPDSVGPDHGIRMISRNPAASSRSEISPSV